MRNNWQNLANIFGKKFDEWFLVEGYGDEFEMSFQENGLWGRKAEYDDDNMLSKEHYEHINKRKTAEIILNLINGDANIYEMEEV